MKEMGDKYGKGMDVGGQSEQERDLYERDINEQSARNNYSDDKGVDETDIREERNANKNNKKKKRKSGSKFRSCLVFVQHLMLMCVAIAVFYMIAGSTVVINGRSLILDPAEAGVEYEDSDIFDILYGESVVDIIRFGVIRSQLETNGKFDGNKIIDVTAYNYRNIGIPEKYVTARYYLGDLLKWSNYGVETSTKYMSVEELDSFLGDKTMVTNVDPDSKYYNTSDASYYMKSDIGNYTFVDDVSANMLPIDEYGGYYDEDFEEKIEVPVYVNRYKTVDGKNIEAYTADLPSYKELCYNVVTAIENLNINYDEYLAFQDKFDKDNTNILYCIEKTIDDNTEYYTNMGNYTSVDRMKTALSNKNVSMADFFREELGDKFSEGNGIYLYYSPSDMIYESNSPINESTVSSLVRQYDYAYPENIRIWIGVDTSYPVNDAFYQGMNGYKNYMPYFWQYGVLAVFAFILYLVLLIYLTIMAGRESDEDGKTFIGLTAFDRINTEGAAVILAAVVTAISVATVCISELAYVYRDYIEEIYANNLKSLAITIGIAVFLLDLIFTFFYYSLVRRIKAGRLWRNSYLRRLVIKCGELVKEVYNNSNIVIKIWVPYIIFLLFNLLMVLTESIGLILFALVLDMVCGALIYRDTKERQDIVSGIRKIAEGNFSYQIELEKLHGDNIVLAESVNSIGNGIKNAVEISMKDERMKTELITNVSHDIKTPLTSIINYVDLIKREDVDNERVRSYIKVLDEKSQRLKQLIDDLVEASKISSGNINLHFEKINLTELLNQTIGEFSEKFEQKGLNIVMNGNATNVFIEADSRSIWRVIENLFNNVYKYALEHTRVYVTLNHIYNDKNQIMEQVEIIIKNISANELNCNPEELTERFIRGDESRTTEGSGLGLSIAKNLTEAQNGTFEIQLDGDLFKVILTFPVLRTDS